MKNGSRGETRKDPAVRCNVSDVVAKDIVPQNAYPECQMGVAERERGTKGDIHARSVAVMGMKQRLSLYATQSPCTASRTKRIQASTIGALCGMCG